MTGVPQMAANALILARRARGGQGALGVADENSHHAGKILENRLPVSRGGQGSGSRERRRYRSR
jgi:hypothetical protein